MSDAFGPELPVTAAELWKENAVAPTLPTRPSAPVDAAAAAEAAAAHGTPQEVRPESRRGRGDPG